MFSSVNTVAFKGIDVIGIDVQVQISNGMSTFNIVGLADKAVAESKERIRAAFNSIGLNFPYGRLTVNLAPADIQKEGTLYDLPIVLGILSTMGIINQNLLTKYIVIGELSLNGSITKVDGALPAAIFATTENFGLICPKDSGGEAAWASDIEILAPKNLTELIDHFNGTIKLERPIAKIESSNDSSTKKICFSDIKGQYSAKRAMQIAAVGGHHMLMVGPPGSGKSMLASRLTTILPELSPEESLELTMIYSIAGEIRDGLIKSRPFRDPHYTASLASIVGGGLKSKPGEISLAHKGVLFLDELPEFSRQTLESLRQPLETGYVIISRANSHIKYPAKPQIIAAMNPCKCGYHGDPTRECKRAAVCKKEYFSKLSGPLIERIDMQIDVPRVEYHDLITNKKSETSKEILASIIAARNFSRERLKNLGCNDIILNSELTNTQIKEFCNLTKDAEDFLNDYANKRTISARTYFKLMKIARSIADYDLNECITDFHVKEAIGYKIF